MAQGHAGGRHGSRGRVRGAGAAQGALLRILEDPSVRVIVASGVNLAQAMDARQFRRDLYQLDERLERALVSRDPSRVRPEQEKTAQDDGP